jgi:pyridoxamine 5'-phosphate oxidase
MIALNEPIDLFSDWQALAAQKEPNDPDAVALATVDAQGRPSVRMVLLKAVDTKGFVFYTNIDSQKGRELAENANAALCFHWKGIRRQVRVQGRAALVSDGEADDYFASRAKDSQIGAWASIQSQPMEGRFDLEKRVARFAAKHVLGKVPRPEYWSGYRIVPNLIEFWEDRPFRLHDRTVYERDGEGWKTTKLYP